MLSLSEIMVWKIFVVKGEKFYIAGNDII